MIQSRTMFVLTAVVALIAGIAPPAAAADPPTPGWYFDADVGGVWTGGNSESNALGASALLRRIYPRWRFRLSGQASQTQATSTTRTATGTQDDFEVNEVKTTEKTAEFYNALAAGRFDISKHFFALGGVDWMRNRPAGIDSRTLFAAGAGNTWRDSDALSLSTFYNFTYTFQDDVVSNPITENPFPGFQVGYAYAQQITASTKIESDAVVDFNLDTSEDVRVNWYAALPVSINSLMELKPSLRVMWRNDPALQTVDQIDPGTGQPTGGTLDVPLNEFDTIFTLALVIKFEPSKEG
jgi:putative salt-induced outer membrane protein YdiY